MVATNSTAPADLTATLARARVTNDIPLLHACRRALAGDAEALQGVIDRLEMERLMGGVVRAPAALSEAA